ncbi:cold-regulated 413 inner membrane protein 1, chloroplastic isoform X2 [Triticum aestivum]|uniref:cold-regulated 413 inner membrane protein 1, chloroplastic isoform X2 n=1 Tax=Triticum aestivum TaxID=4565 RepID=UPI001D015CB1|nr:cold-regulated 413 inner membrane protein 1, chloroplastic-like isoform X2 [Triticum aestivum]
MCSLTHARAPPARPPLITPVLRFDRLPDTDTIIHPPATLPAPTNRSGPDTMSISLRLAIPTAAPCPAPPPRARAARNAGCSPLSAAAVPVRTTAALRGCAALPLRPQPLVRPCRSRGSAVVCSASAYLSPPTTQWVSVAAAAVLLLAKGTGIHKSFLVPLFVLQAPTAVISWIKSEYGLWTAFLALVVRLFLPFPGRVTRKIHTSCLKSIVLFDETWNRYMLLTHVLLSIAGELELPLSTMLAVSVAPYQVMNVRGTQGGAIVSLVLAAYLAFQHFTRTGGIGKAFDQGSIVATMAIICIAVINVILLF